METMGDRYGQVLLRITKIQIDEATEAELRCPGSGLCTILAALNSP